MKDLISSNNKLQPIANANSIITRLVTVKQERIINIDLEETRTLDDNLLVYCTFSVPNSGYHHVNQQLTIKCIADVPTNANFMQFGLCLRDQSDLNQSFNSMLINTDALPDQVITDNLSSLKYLDKDLVYSLWCNFQSTSNCMFQYEKDFSHLLLMKLSD